MARILKYKPYISKHKAHIFEKVPCNFSCVGNALKIFLYFPEIPRIFTARPGLSVLEQKATHLQEPALTETLCRLRLR